MDAGSPAPCRSGAPAAEVGAFARMSARMIEFFFDCSSPGPIWLHNIQPLAAELGAGHLAADPGRGIFNTVNPSV